MKTKLLIIIWILFPFWGFSQANTNDFKWEGKTIFSENFEIWNLPDQSRVFYYMIDNYIKITSEKKCKISKIAFENGEVTKISDSIYKIVPGKIGRSLLTINNDSKSFIVSELPSDKIKIKFSESKSPFSDCISIADLINSKTVVAYYNHNNFKIRRYGVSYVKNKSPNIAHGDSFQDSISVQFKMEMQESIGVNDYVWIGNVGVYPYGTRSILLSDFDFKVVDNYQNEFIRKNLKVSASINDFNLMENDLRIKIEGQPKKQDIQVVEDLANELNEILETIKVKIVDQCPSLTIIIDTLTNETYADTVKINGLLKQGFKRNRNGDSYIKEVTDNFFPFNKNYILYFDKFWFGNNRSEFGFENSKSVLRKAIIELLVYNNMEYYGIDDDLKPESSNTRYLLKTIYSRGGEEKVKTILNEQYIDKERTPAYFLIIVLSICLMFVFSEIYNYYNIGNYLGRIKFRIIKRIIDALLIAQIPVIAWLIISFFNNGTHKLFREVPFWEIRLVPFFVLIGLFLFFLDKLLGKIKTIWLNTFLNLVLSFFSVVLAYQLMYYFKAHEMLKLTMISWEMLLIPLFLTLYRLYIRFEKNKITSLLQEKELELSKQKELKFKSDLNALQARINPHFLYNSLNSLASLTHIDQDRTEKMALSLSKLFRYNINKNEELHAPLKDEIEMAEIYLQVEKNRFEDRLNYRIELQDKLKEFVIPRFILQPLAENAVKHGISKITGKGIIRINIFEESQKVIIEIYDNGPEFPGGLISGYGLQNVYEKLKLLYQKDFDISFVNNPEKKLVITLTR